MKLNQIIAMLRKDGYKLVPENSIVFKPEQWEEVIGKIGEINMGKEYLDLVFEILEGVK